MQPVASSRGEKGCPQGALCGCGEDSTCTRPRGQLLTACCSDAMVQSRQARMEATETAAREPEVSEKRAEVPSGACGVRGGGRGFAPAFSSSAFLSLLLTLQDYDIGMRVSCEATVDGAYREPLPLPSSCQADNPAQLFSRLCVPRHASTQIQPRS